MINYVEGDLFDAVINDNGSKGIFIPHVVNCKGGFGSGFVVPLGRTFPEVKRRYLEWANDGKGGPDFGLGEVQFVSVTPNDGKEIIVANMCAQTLGGKRPLFYNKLAICMDTVAAQIPENEYRIVAPMFGSALAGGNWDFIEELINDCWLKRGIDVTIHYLPGQTPMGWTPPNKRVKTELEFPYDTYTT
jgi:hypothetical protein